MRLVDRFASLCKFFSRVNYLLRFTIYVGCLVFVLAIRHCLSLDRVVTIFRREVSIEQQVSVQHSQRTLALYTVAVMVFRL